MLSKKEKQLMDEAEIREDLDRIKDQKEAQTASEMPTKWKLFSFIGMIGFGAIIALGVSFLLRGLLSGFYWNSVNNEGTLGLPLYMIPAATLILVGAFGLIMCIGGLAKKKRVFAQSIMLSPDGNIPEYPEETVATKPNAPLARDVDKPMAIRKVYSDDPEKRVIKMDKKKVERVLDHNITFPKLREAFIANLARLGYGIDDDSAGKLIASLANCRLFLLQDLPSHELKPIAEALATTMQGRSALCEGKIPLKSNYAQLVPALEKNEAFILGIDGSALPVDFFEGYEEAIADYSCEHNLEDKGIVSMNLQLLINVPTSKVESLPSILLEKASVLSLNLSRLTIPSKEEAMVVRSSGDEIRYLAFKEKGAHYLSDELVVGFDTLFEFTSKKGYRIDNDCENAFERLEAAMLLLNFNEDKTAGFTVSSAYLPYLISVLDKASINEDGGLRETLERSFPSEEASSPIRAVLRNLVKKGGEEQ